MTDQKQAQKHLKDWVKDDVNTFVDMFPPTTRARIEFLLAFTGQEINTCINDGSFEELFDAKNVAKIVLTKLIALGALKNSSIVAKTVVRGSHKPLPTVDENPSSSPTESGAAHALQSLRLSPGAEDQLVTPPPVIEPGLSSVPSSDSLLSKLLD